MTSRYWQLGNFEVSRVIVDDNEIYIATQLAKVCCYVSGHTVRFGSGVAASGSLRCVDLPIWQ